MDQINNQCPSFTISQEWRRQYSLGKNNYVVSGGEGDVKIAWGEGANCNGLSQKFQYELLILSYIDDCALTSHVLHFQSGHVYGNN